MKDRFIKNWVTTVLGLGIVVASFVLVYMGKLTESSLVMLVPAGLAVSGLKYKNDAEGNA